MVPEEAGFPTHRIRFVQIGESAGPTISLPAEALRTSGLEMRGVENIPPEAVQEAIQQSWEWARQSELRTDIEIVPLKDIAAAWNRDQE